MMSVLILGGTGVLSSAIATECVSAGHRVTIVTDGLGKLREPAGIERHLIVDRNDDKALKAVLRNGGAKKWDLVVDSICYNSRQAASLFSAINSNSEHTVVISTTISYDRRSPFPLKTESPIAPPSELGEYGLGKVEMERFWLETARQHLHPVTILRLPHVLGVGCELGIVPLHNRDPLLIERILKKRPLLLADGGRQLLQVVFNCDVAKVILAAHRNPTTFGQVYNCANPEILTPVQYFETIASKLNVELDVVNVSSEAIWESDWGWSPTTVSRILDMETMKSDIGLVPTTSYQEAIAISLIHLSARPRKESDEADYFQVVEDKLKADCQEMSSVLSAVSSNRLRTEVDRRMNDRAPRFN